MNEEVKTPVSPEPVGQAPEKKKKKGCLFGCLGAIALVIIVIAVLAIVGYRNRHELMPFMARNIGTPIEEGLPAEYLEEAYRLDLEEPGSSLKVIVSRKPVSQTAEDFYEYYENEGWSIQRRDADFETLIRQEGGDELTEAEQEQILTFTRFIEERAGDILELTREEERKFMVTFIRGEESAALIFSSLME